MVAVGVECVGDPAVRVECAHEQGDPALAERLGGDEVACVGHRVRGCASAQHQFDAILEGDREELVQANRGDLGEPAAELAVRRPPPEGQRAVQNPRRPLRLRVHQGARPPVGRLERVGVDRAVRRREEVAAWLGADAVGPAPHPGAQPGHHLVQRVGG